ncbi:MAG: hypothetical protein J6Y41_04720 [Bacteroidaceae bacterium]|nr:hypothetical protein [Bacteroidaceae bacterium]
MKKIYMAPLTEVVKINAEQVVCTSVENFIPQVNKSGSVDGGDVLDKEDEFLDIKKALNNDMEDEMDELW